MRRERFAVGGLLVVGEFYALRRGWMNDAMFSERDTFDRRSAWSWLIEHAASAPTEAHAEGQTVTLAKGELIVSIRHMGGQWGWATTKVARFVSELYRNRFLCTRKLGRSMVITICDYADLTDQEQPENRTQETILEQSWNDFPVDAGAGDAPAVIKTSSDEEVSKEDCSLRSQRGRAKPPDALFEDWYAEYPHKIGRGAAERAWPGALARASPETLIEGLRRYIASKPPDRRWCAPAVWLNQKRWLDEPAENDGAEPNARRQQQSGVSTLFEGAFRAAEKWEREGDRGAGGPAVVPLLDSRRSG